MTERRGAWNDVHRPEVELPVNYVYIYIYIYMCMYIYIYIHTLLNTCMYVCVYIYIYMSLSLARTCMLAITFAIRSSLPAITLGPSGSVEIASPQICSEQLGQLWRNIQSYIRKGI